MKNLLGAIACMAISGMCAFGCHGFEPADPFSSAPLERTIAKVGNSDCETSRERIQQRVKDTRGKGTATPSFAGAWFCQTEGRGEVEVLHVKDDGRMTDGLLESWDDVRSMERHDLPPASQQFIGGHDGESFVFYSEDPSVDFSARLTPNGEGLKGTLALRNETHCFANNYSCTRRH